MSFLKFNAPITNTAKGVKDSIEFPVNTANMDKTKSNTRIKLRIEDVTSKKRQPLLYTLFCIFFLHLNVQYILYITKQIIYLIGILTMCEIYSQRS